MAAILALPVATLHRLVRENDLEGIRAFLAAQDSTAAVINEVDDADYTPLFYAVSLPSVDVEVVAELLAAGADIGYVKVTSYPSYSEDLDDLEEAPGCLPEELAASLPEILAASEGKEFREPLIKAALNRGDVAVVKLLQTHGADLTVVDEHGYTAMLNAVYGEGDRLPLVKYFIGLGLPLDGTSTYGESPVTVAYRLTRFPVLKALVDAGASTERLGWTPLIHAVAVGTRVEVEEQLAGGPDLQAHDQSGFTALDVALLRGDFELAKLLRDRGASPAPIALCHAAEGGNVAAVEWLIEQGLDLEVRDEMNETPLAIALERNHISVVEALLRQGADPNAPLDYESMLGKAIGPEVLKLLLDYGADPAGLDHEGRRVLLGLRDHDSDLLFEVTPEQYMAERYPKEGTQNPQELTGPFRVAMIRAGINAYWARKHFEDPPTFACGLRGEQRPPPVWCADRFGQTITFLPDGRVILIAGEHEDSYDPDFCIYNDVFVFSPEGEIRIFGYPYSVFPPTDFHTATLVGSDIYILGSLGYVGERGGGMPVFRLRTDDYRIERIDTTGADPGRIYKHRATLVDDHTIRVEGGTRISEEECGENEGAFLLDLRTQTWSRA